MGTHLAAVTQGSGRGGERAAGPTPDHLGCPGDRRHGNPQEDGPDGGTQPLPLQRG